MLLLLLLPSSRVPALSRIPLFVRSAIAFAVAVSCVCTNDFEEALLASGDGRRERSKAQYAIFLESTDSFTVFVVYSVKLSCSFSRMGFVVTESLLTLCRLSLARPVNVSRKAEDVFRRLVAGSRRKIRGSVSVWPADQWHETHSTLLSMS